jgi:hypothetical protein
MSVDLMLPAAEKIVLVLEGIGDDKIRVNSSSLDHPLVILPEQVTMNPNGTTTWNYFSFRGAILPARSLQSVC